MPPNISLPTLPLPLTMEDMEEDAERVPTSQSNGTMQSSSTTSGTGEDLRLDISNTTVANASTVPLLIQVRFSILYISSFLLPHFYVRIMWIHTYILSYFRKSWTLNTFGSLVQRDRRTKNTLNLLSKKPSRRKRTWYKHSPIWPTSDFSNWSSGARVCHCSKISWWVKMSANFFERNPWASFDVWKCKERITVCRSAVHYLGDKIKTNPKCLVIAMFF